MNQEILPLLSPSMGAYENECLMVLVWRWLTLQIEYISIV